MFLGWSKTCNLKILNAQQHTINVFHYLNNSLTNKLLCDVVEIKQCATSEKVNWNLLIVHLQDAEQSFFPTAVSEEELVEAKRKNSLKRLFGSSKIFLHTEKSCQRPDLQGSLIIQSKAAEQWESTVTDTYVSWIRTAVHLKWCYTSYYSHYLCYIGPLCFI